RVRTRRRPAEGRHGPTIGTADAVDSARFVSHWPSDAPVRPHGGRPGVLDVKRLPLDLVQLGGEAGEEGAIGRAERTYSFALQIRGERGQVDAGVLHAREDRRVCTAGDGNA